MHMNLFIFYFIQNYFYLKMSINVEKIYQVIQSYLCLLPVPVVELNVEHDGPEDESSGQ